MPIFPPFIDVNLPFYWADMDDDEYAGEVFTDKYPLESGMYLDCSCEGKRRYILVGDMNTSNGHCGCCNTRITFVYRFTNLLKDTTPTK
jgi:hypothetical protein